MALLSNGILHTFLNYNSYQENRATWQNIKWKKPEDKDICNGKDA